MDRGDFATTTESVKSEVTFNHDTFGQDTTSQTPTKTEGNAQNNPKDERVIFPNLPTKVEVMIDDNNHQPDFLNLNKERKYCEI